MVSTNEYMRAYMSRRYRSRRKQALKAMGGACKRCGSKKKLEFDHKNRRRGDDFVICKRLAGISEKKFLAELKKCQLLCAKCHREKTAAELGRTIARGTHGTLSAYRYCGPPKCAACKKAKRDWMRQWRERASNVDGDVPDS